MDVRYSSDLAGVDWTALVRALVADEFSNGRTPAQLRRSFERSFATCLAHRRNDVVGTARLLSDGVCNAYLVDVWTQSRHRRRGIGGELVRRLMDTVPGQHVVLFTEHAESFYAGLGFAREDVGMSRVVGRWLEPRRPGPG